MGDIIKDSNLAIYHLIQKGVEDRDIFLDEDDYIFYINELDRCVDVFKFSLLSYALMKNHTHLLVKIDPFLLPTFMHKLGNNYSHYFNKKYFRKGHLFGGRYKKKLVKNDGQLLQTIRYINQNPLRSNLKYNYKWCSLNEIFKKGSSLIDLKTLEEILPISFEALINLLKSEYNYEEKVNDKEKSLSELEFYTKKLSKIKEKFSENYNKNLQDSIIYYLYQKNLSLREISEIIGLSHTYVQKRIKKCDEKINKDISFTNWLSNVDEMFKSL